jgi:hypothetical protein
MLKTLELDGYNIHTKALNYKKQLIYIITINIRITFMNSNDRTD